MKALVVALALSIAGNVALVAAFALKPALAPPAVRDFFQRAPSTAEADAALREQIRAAAEERAVARQAEAERAAITRSRLWSALDSDDLPVLVTRLRTAGFSRSVVLAILNVKLDARFAERFKALTADFENTPFWKPDPMSTAGGTRYREEYSQLSRERSRLLRELLGDDALAWGGTDPSTAQRRQFGDIPREKIDLIQRINDDYAEMSSQIRASMQGITLPEDRELLALLEREKRADLAGILTPAELEEYEMRNSPVTSRLRNTLTLLDASNDEFQTIFRIHQAYNDRINPVTSGLVPSSMVEQRREALGQMNEQLKAALGDARYAEYARASNPEYQQLHRIAQRENIPADTVVRAFAIRDEIAGESVRIIDNASLPAEQKRTALQSLAQRARTQIIGTLGTTAGEAYIQSARWLPSIERGGAVTFGPDGNPAYRSVSAPVPPTQ